MEEIRYHFKNQKLILISKILTKMLIKFPTVQNVKKKEKTQRGECQPTCSSRMRELDTQ